MGVREPVTVLKTTGQSTLAKRIPTQPEKEFRTKQHTVTFLSTQNVIWSFPLSPFHHPQGSTHNLWVKPQVRQETAMGPEVRTEHLSVATRVS